MTSIQDIKAYMKANNITYQELSNRSKIPLNTLKNLFRGKTQNPRVDTLKAIEKALGLDNQAKTEYTDEEKELFNLITQLTDEEVEELSKFVDFIISKRK